jgi:hypothetical protein
MNAMALFWVATDDCVSGGWGVAWRTGFGGRCLRFVCGGVNPVCGGTNPVCREVNPVCGVTNPVCGEVNPVCDVTNPVCGGFNLVFGGLWGVRRALDEVVSGVSEWRGGGAFFEYPLKSVKH